MELKMVGTQGKNGGTLNAMDEVFGREFNESLVHSDKVLLTKAAVAKLQEMLK